MLTGRLKIHCRACDQWYMALRDNTMGSVQLGFCQPCVISGAAEQLETGGATCTKTTAAPSKNEAAGFSSPPSAPGTGLVPPLPPSDLSTSVPVRTEGTTDVSPARDDSLDSKNDDAPAGNPSAGGASTKPKGAA